MFCARAAQTPMSRKGRGFKAFVDLTITVIIRAIESFRLARINESVVVVTIPINNFKTVSILVGS